MKSKYVFKTVISSQKQQQYDLYFYSTAKTTVKIQIRTFIVTGITVKRIFICKLYCSATVKKFFTLILSIMKGGYIRD